jgi:hypothetical protein
MPVPLNLFLETGRRIALAPSRSRRLRAHQWIWRTAYTSAVVFAWYNKREIQMKIQGVGGGRWLANLINDYASGIGMTALFLGSVGAGHFFRRRKLWVCVVGWSRVYLGQHFLWNILAGPWVGMLASAATVATWEQLHGKAPVTPVVIE